VVSEFSRIGNHSEMHEGPNRLLLE